MGLGLFVGVAAVGVIAFRTVVERRQQIGMLRAIGYTRGMIGLTFLIESAFIAFMGVLSGVVFALILARQLITEQFANQGVHQRSSMPWLQVLRDQRAGLRVRAADDADPVAAGGEHPDRPGAAVRVTSFRWTCRAAALFEVSGFQGTWRCKPHPQPLSVDGEGSSAAETPYREMGRPHSTSFLRADGGDSWHGEPRISA